MNKKVRLDVTVFLIVAAIIISCLATTFVINNKIGSLTEVQAAFSKIKNIDDLVNEHYIGAIDSESLANAIAKGYIVGLGDAHAAYYSKEEYRAYQAQITGQYEGIGATVVWIDNVGLEVTHVSKGSPAETAGVQIGDIVTMVDNASVLALGHDDAVSKLNGTVGTVANFTVTRGAETLVFSVMRSQYDKVTVEYKKLGTIGYVKITGFNNLTGDYFGAAIDALETQGVSAFVFDVRNNPGGTIDSVVECVDRLIGKGTVATAVRKDVGDGANKTVYEAVTAQEVKLPMVVLADQNTASGGELFAAALMDYDKAVLIGESTYGKGTGQTTYKLPDGSYLKITDFTYYPPSGTSYQLVGLTPDTRITLTDNQQANRYTMAYPDDPYMIAACEALGVDVNVLVEENYENSDVVEGGE